MRNESYFPRAIKHTVREFLEELRMERNLESTTISFRFSLNRAIYWFCSLNHSGQNSRLYQILSTSQYRPGAFETEPKETDENLDWEIYQALNHYMGV